VDPQILKAGFRIAVLIAGVAFFLLIFEPRDSAEFVVSAMALVIGLSFMVLVAVLVWYSTPKMPRAHNASVQRRRKQQ
jgi:protein-S-isoprenylcysteine O-methyltransferase Ste14